MTHRVKIVYDALRYNLLECCEIVIAALQIACDARGDFQMTVETMPIGASESFADADALVERGVQRWWQAAEKTAASVRKLVLAYVGAGAYVWDGAAAVYRSGERLLAGAEKRGVRMEQDVRRRFGNFEAQAVNEMRKLQGQADESIQHMRESHSEEIEKRVELALANMGLPSRERLERLSQEIDALNQKLDEQILRLPAEPILDPLG
jgi:hypothetical protein